MPAPRPATAWDTWSDQVYDDESPNQVYDLRVPKGNGTNTNPLIIWVHGGGWLQGDESPNWVPFKQETFLQWGFAFASIRYRLSTEANWPAQIQDVLSAVRDIRVRALERRVYPAKFGMWGVSAGGHLAAMVAAAGDDPAFRVGNWDRTPHNIAIAVCDSPPCDFPDWVATSGLSPDPAAMCTELFGAPVAQVLDTAIAASPARRMTTGAAPMWVRHGSADNTVPLAQPKKLEKAARDLGITTDRFLLTPYANAGHAAPAFYTATELGKVKSLMTGWLT